MAWSVAAGVGKSAMSGSAKNVGRLVDDVAAEPGLQICIGSPAATPDTTSGITFKPGSRVNPAGHRATPTNQTSVGCTRRCGEGAGRTGPPQGWARDRGCVAKPRQYCIDRPAPTGPANHSGGPAACLIRVGMKYERCNRFGETRFRRHAAERRESRSGRSIPSRSAFVFRLAGGAMPVSESNGGYRWIRTTDLGIMSATL